MTIYPRDYDNESTLRHVKNDASSILVSEYIPGNDFLTVENPIAFNADGGYVTIYSMSKGPDINNRTSSFKYENVVGNKLTGIMPTKNGEIQRESGSKIVSNVMAEDRNELVDSIINLQKEIGNLGTKDVGSVEWFANMISQKIKKPRPWFSISPERQVLYGTPVKFTDLTSRLQYWQVISWLWDFGDGGTSTERNPSHSYQNPGLYTVSLKVINDYGEGSVTIKNAILVMGEAPHEAEIILTPQNAIVGETAVVARATPIENEHNPVESVSWEVGDGSKLKNGRVASFVLARGGRFAPKIVQKTRFGNIRVQPGPDINAVERQSLWCLIQSPEDPHASIEEFIPSIESWKGSKSPILIPRNWEEAPDNIDGSDNFLSDGAFHDIPGEMESLVLYSESKSSMGIGEYNALTETYESHPSIQRPSGWTSVRINERNDCPIDSRQVYVIFSGGDSQPYFSVQHYGMTTRTWETISIDDITDSASASDYLKSSASVVPPRLPRRWRSISWGDSIYILGTGNQGYLDNFMVFKPATMTWTFLPKPSFGGVLVDIENCAMFSLPGGIYVVSASGSINVYNPRNNTWTSFTSQPIWMNSSKGAVKDSYSIFKGASMSESPKINHSKGYISGVNFDGVTMFDDSKKTFRVISYRKSGILSAMGMM
jgi:PKD repeat protein